MKSIWIGSRIIVWLAALTTSAVAANVTLTGSDSGTVYSYSSGANWSDGTAPSAGNFYFTGGYTVQGNTAGFAGNSLQIDSGGLLSVGLTTYANNVVLNGGTLASLGGARGLFNTAGFVVMNADSTLDGSAGTLTFNNVICGSGALTIRGSVTIYGDSPSGGASTQFVPYRNHSTYSGDTTVLSGGTLTFTYAYPAGGYGCGNLIVNSGGSVSLFRTSTINGLSGSGSVSVGTTWSLGNNNAAGNFSGALTGGGTLTTKTGSGIQIFGGANTYTGPTTLQGGGTLQLDYATQNNSKLPDAGVLTFNTSALDLAGGSHTEVLGSTTLATGSGSRVTRSSGSSVLRMNAITRSAGSAIDFGADSIADTDTLNVNGILGGWATVNGQDWAINSTGAGDGAITALASYSGALPATGGSAADNDTQAGSLTLSGPVAANTVKISNTGNSDSLALGANNLTITSSSATSLGGILYVGGNDNLYTISGSGRIVSSAANQELLFNVNTGTLTVSAVIGAAGSSGAMTKTGPGTLVLGTANAYTGTTSVNGGTLAYGANDAISSGAVTINGGTLNLSSYNDTVGAVTLTAGSIAGSGTLTGTSYTMNSDANTSVSAVLAGGAATLTKSGSGVLTLSGANTYGGLTTISGGVLRYGCDNALGAGAVTINGGAEGAQGAFLELGSYSDSVGVVTLTYGDITGTGTLTGTSFAINGNGSNPFGRNISPEHRVTVVLAGAGATLTKSNGSIAALTGANTYSGETTIAGGVLRANDGVGLPAASLLTISGATLGTGFYALLETGADLARTGGSAAGNLRITAGTSGFSARGGPVQVAFGTLGSPTALTWGTAPFQPATLVLNGVSATDTLDFKNPVDLNAAVRTVIVDANVATMSGVLSGTGASGLTKSCSTYVSSGWGTLVLTGANTYAGATTVSAGVLSVRHNTALGTTAAGTTVSSGAALELEGGVTVGTETLSLNGAGINTMGALRSISGANEWQGLLTLAGAARINTDSGSLNLSHASTITGATFGLSVGGAGNTAINSIIGTTTGTLTKDGAGTLTLTGASTFTGATAVNGGTLVLGGASGALATASVTLAAGTTLELDNSAANNANRLTAATPGVTMNGATFRFRGLSGAASSESLGTLTLSAGANTIDVANGAGAGSSSYVTFSSLARTAPATVNFTYSGAGTLGGGAASEPRVIITGQSAGVISYAMVNGTSLAEYVAGTGVRALVTDAEFDGHSDQTGLDTGYTAARGAAYDDLSASRSIASLTISSPGAGKFITLGSSGAYTLNVTGGGILLAGADSFEITRTGTSTGTLSGTNPYITILNAGAVLTISAPISGANTVTLAGAGKLVLSAVNTFTGALTLGGGTVEVGGTGNLNSGNYAGAISIASGSLLLFSTSSNQTLTVNPTGAGNLTWAGSGVLQLTTSRGATPPVLTVNSGFVDILTSNLGSGPASDLILDGGGLMIKDGGGGTDATAKLFTLGANGATIQIGNLLIPGNNSRRNDFTGTGPLAFTGSGPRTLKFETAVMLGYTFAPAIGDGPGGATSVVMGGTAGANGTWALSGANTYTGTTTVNGGSLSIRKQQSVNGGLAHFTPANVTVVSNACLAVGVGAAPTYFDAAAVATVLDNSHLGGSTPTTGLKAGARFGLDTTAGDFTYGDTLADLGGGNALNVAKHGINVLTLSGNNTYTGTTTIYGDFGTSTLRAGSATAFGPPSTARIAFSFGDYFSAQKLQLYGNDITVAGLNAPVQSWRDGGGGYTIESGSADTGGDGVDTLTVNTAAGTTSTLNNGATLNNGVMLIQDGGARKLALAKEGAGTLELGSTSAGGSAFNTYSGGTSIQAGTLRALRANVFGGAGGTGGTITFGPGSTGTLQLNGAAHTFTALNTDAGTPGTTVVENAHASAAATLTLNNAAPAVSTFAGTLRNGAAGTLALTKAGTGTLTLTGSANYFTGATTVSAGTLDYLNTGATASLTLGGGAAGTAAALNLGSNDLLLGGDVTYTAGTADGAAITGAGGGVIRLLGNRTFTVNDSTATTAELTISTGIQNGDATARNLVKAGAGTLVLSGVNTYTGTTTINANGGVLAFSQLAAIPPGPGGRYITLSGASPVGAVALGYVPSGSVKADLLDRLVQSSSGALALTSSTAEDFDLALNGFPNLSLGAYGSATYTGTLTPNSSAYYLGGGGGTLTMANANAITGAGRTLTINAPGTVILAGANDYTGATTVSAGATLQVEGALASTGIANAGTLIFNNAGSVNFAGAISGAGAIIKNGAGTLTLSGVNTYTGTITINDGTVAFGSTDAVSGNRPIVLNGGTLDIGTSRVYISTLTGAASTITGSGGTLTINQAGNLNIVYPGQFTSVVNLILVRSTLNNVSGQFNLSLTEDSGTTGALTLMGGDYWGAQPSGFDRPVFNGIALKDAGRLSGVTGITLNNGTLYVNNNASSTAINGGTAETSSQDLPDRVNDAAPLTLNGGRIHYLGRASTASAESLGALSVASGMGALLATPGTTGSAELTLASLARADGATLQVDGTNLGTAGNNGRIFVTAALSGNLAPVGGVGVGIVPGVFRGTPAVTPPIAVGYVAGQGFVSVGTAGGPAAYSGALNAAAATDNAVAPSAHVVKAGGQTVNSLQQTAAITFLGASDRLTIASGMLLQTAGTKDIGTAALRGQLTSGLASGELFLIKDSGNGAGGTLGDNQVYSVITDNGGTRVRLVLNNYTRRNLTNNDWNLMAANTYSGGTVMSGGNELYLTGPAEVAGVAPIPAANDPSQGLVINNSRVTLVTTAQQIAAANIVTLNGGSILTFVGANNTLAGIVFNSHGGEGNTAPTVTGGSKLTLTGGIASTSSSAAVVPLISATPLDLNGSAAHDITVAPYPDGNYVSGVGPMNGLTISSVIQNGGFTVKGGGVLNLSNAGSLYAGQLTVENGVLNLGANFNSVSANGPLGNSAAAVVLGGSGTTGTIEYTGGTAASTKPFAMATGGTGAFQVDAAATVLTLSGVLSGNGGLAKTMPGTLLLSNAANTYGGGTTVSGGTLEIGSAGTLGSGAYAGAVSIASGATLKFNTTAAQTLSGAMSGTGALTQNNTGALTVSTSAGAAFNGDVTVSATASPVTLGVALHAANNSWACRSLTTTTTGAGAPGLVFGFGAIAPSTTDAAPLQVNGNVVLFTTPTVSCTGAGLSGLALGSYRLMTWTGTLSGLAPAAVTLPAGVSGNLSVVGNTLYLNITSAAQPLTWQTGTGNWVIGSGTDWKDANSIATSYSEGDTVRFDATPGAGPFTVTLDATVSPNGVTVNNAATPQYTISGSGGIAGSGGLTKTGAGALILSTVNTYAGPTAVNGGLLRASEGAGLPAGSLLSINTAIFETGADLARAGGTLPGNMSIAGGGTSGFSARDGAVQVAFGTLGSPTSLTWGTAPFQPGTLVLNDATANSALTLLNPINLNGATRTVTVNAAAAYPATLGGTIIGSGSSLLTKAGTGKLIIGSANYHVGGTTVSAGTLAIGADEALSSGPLTVSSGATLDMDTFTCTLLSANHYVSGGTVNGTGTLSFSGTLNLGFNNSVPATTINARLAGTGKVQHTAGTSTIVYLNNPNNSYTGGTDVGGSNIGITQFVSGGLGSTGNITFKGSVGALQWASGNTQDISSRLRIDNGIIAQFDTNGNDVDFAGSLGTTTGGLTKLGAGWLTLSPAASALTGAFTHSNGGLVLQNANTGTAGALTVNNNNLAANGWLEVAAGANYTFSSISIAGANGQDGPGIHQTGGTLASSSGFTMAGGNGTKTTYSYMTGGTLNIGTNLRIGDGGAAGGSFNFQFNMSGGSVTVGTTVDVGKYGSAGNGLCQVIVSGGAFTSTGAFYLKDRITNANETDLIMGGGVATVNSAATGLQLGADANSANGRVYLAGTSVLAAHKVVKNSTTTTTANYNTIFFHGGTLRALSDNATDFMGALATPAGGNTALGNSGANVAFVYAGGATIDTQSHNVTVNPALVPRATAANNGVGSVTIPDGTQGSRYAIAPLVTFNTPGGGQAATGYLTLDADGGIAAVVVTDPGSGYTAPATMTLSGGVLLTAGGVAATPAGWTANMIASNGGGLTKRGTGTATLANVNTYTGPTAIEEGTLALTAAGAIAASSAVTLGTNAVLDVSAKGSFALAAGQPVTVDISPVGAGWAGRIAAAGLDISAANVTLNPLAALDDPVYILADYTSLTGTEFGTVTGVPAGYAIDYAYSGGTQIALVVQVMYLPPAGGVSSVNYTVSLDASSSTPGSLNLVQTASQAANTVEVDTAAAAGTVQLQGFVLSLAGLSISGPNTFEVSATAGGGLQHKAAGASTLAVANNSAAAVTLSAPLLDNGGTLLALSGTGTTVLSGESTFAGAATISSGTVRLGAAGSGANTPLGTAAAGTVVAATGAALDLNGFTLATAEPLSLNGTGVAGGGALLNSSATSVTYSGPLALGGPGTITAGSGAIALSNTGTITGAGFGLTLGGSAAGCSLAGVVATGAGTLTKSGSGTWSLTGDNTYSGLTSVEAGTLLVNNSSGSGTGSGAVTVQNLATLGGTGSVAGAVTIQGGGSLAAGAAGAGTLTLSAANTSLTFDDGAALEYEIGGTDASPASDRVNLTGASSTIAFGATATLRLHKLAGATLNPTGRTFVLFDYNGADPVLPAWTIDLGDTGWTGGSVALSGSSVVLTGIIANAPASEGTILLFR